MSSSRTSMSPKAPMTQPMRFCRPPMMTIASSRNMLPMLNVSGATYRIRPA
jgi:hypothetical protein